MKLQEKRGEIAAFALATGSTAAAAAKKAHVSERTVHSWLRKPEFKQRVRDIRGEILERAAGRMLNILTCATDALRSLLASESDHVKLGAARTILETGLKYHESLNLEERIKKLEEGGAQSQDTHQASGSTGPASTEPGTTGDPVPPTA